MPERAECQSLDEFVEAFDAGISVGCLALAHAGIGDSGVERLATTLEKDQSSSVSTLDLPGNELRDPGLARLASALGSAGGCTVTRLNLAYNSISLEGVVHLAEALEKNIRITYLDLAYNFIGDPGVVQLAASLERNFSVATLKLAANGIGDKGGVRLATMLEKNATVTSVDLSGNNIGNVTAERLAAALETSSTLSSLVLTQNDVTEKGAALFAGALLQNASLRELNLQGNPIGGQGTENLVGIVSHRTPVCVLDLDWGRWPRSGPHTLRGWGTTSGSPRHAGWGNSSNRGVGTGAPEGPLADAQATASPATKSLLGWSSPASVSRSPSGSAFGAMPPVAEGEERSDDGDDDNDDDCEDREPTQKEDSGAREICNEKDVSGSETRDDTNSASERVSEEVEADIGCSSLADANRLAPCASSDSTTQGSSKPKPDLPETEEKEGEVEPTPSEAQEVSIPESDEAQDSGRCSRSSGLEELGRRLLAGEGTEVPDVD